MKRAVELLGTSLEGLEEESLLGLISRGLNIAVFVRVVELHALPHLMLVFGPLLQRTVKFSHVLLHVSLVEAWWPYVGIILRLLDLGFVLVLLVRPEGVSGLAEHVEVAKNILFVLVLFLVLLFEELCCHFLDVLHFLGFIVLA